MIIKPINISKENFSEFGDLISSENINPIDINEGYAKRFDDLAKVSTEKNQGKTCVSIFSALKRSFPMKIDMMEKHPLGSQAFIPMKETVFLSFVAPASDLPDINKIDLESLDSYLSIGYVPSDKTIVKGVNKLPQAHALTYDMMTGDRKI